MSLPVLDIGLIGAGTSLLREACRDVANAGNDAFFANAWESEHGSADPFPVYYKLERSVSSYGYDDPGIDVSYSKSVDAWYHGPDADISSSTDLPILLLGLALFGAIQPTGRILGRSFGTPWIVRCFPIVYAADAVVALARWAYLVVVARMGIRRAASTILEGRLTDGEPDADAEEEEHWMFALTKSKSATPARWVAFVMGGLPLLSRLWFAQGALHAQVLGSMYLGAWLIFEAFLLAATIDDVDEEDANAPASPRKPEEPAAGNSDDSSTESPVLVTAPAETTTQTEKDKTASEPDTATPLVGGGSSPVAAARVDVSSVPARTYSPFDTLMRRFCAAAILASGIYHAFPLVAPEFFLWHERLAGDAGSREASSAMDIDSLVGVVVVVLSAYFWTGIVAQDLGTSWFSPLDDDGSVFELMATAQSVSISLWIASWGSELFLGGTDDEDGYGHLLWYAVCLGAFALVQGVGRVRVSIGMDAVDVRRVVTLFISLSYYILEDDESKEAAVRTVVCRAGGLCYRYLQGGQ